MVTLNRPKPLESNKILKTPFTELTELYPRADGAGLGSLLSWKS
jgi:hypothetical protein